MKEGLYKNNTRKGTREMGGFATKKSLVYIIVGDILRIIVEIYIPYKYFCPKSQHLQITIDRSSWVLLEDERSIQTHT
jgi:hypothetical protein